jgi:GTP cyclohydrolase II
MGMTDPIPAESVRPRPAAAPGHLLAQAVTDLRAGSPVLVVDGVEAAWAFAMETAADGAVMARGDATAPWRLVLTAERGAALGLDWRDAAPAVWPLRRLDLAVLKALADPLAVRDHARRDEVIAPAPVGAHRGVAQAVVTLVKRAELLPSALILPVAPATDVPAMAGRERAIWLTTGEIAGFLGAGPGLRRIAEARVPLAGAETCRVVAFRPDDGGPDHLAVIVGAPDLRAPVLTRLHSACLTGDLLGSLRCDCGDQLRGAVTRLTEAGGGVLLYLAEEGRGIGIVNKLRAYRLQDAGFDTVDANLRLGFRADERGFSAAAAMLRALEIERVRLLTNNPAKIRALEAEGVAVTERVAHAFPPNPHNQAYLATKAERAGHLLP